MTTTEQLAQALRECAEAAWHKDSHLVHFDSTVAFGPNYNFCGLDGIQREEFHGEHDCIVWPCGSGRKWSAYCTYQGSMWFDRFDTVEEAKAVCMELLAKVSPNDPFVKARAVLAAHEAEKAAPTLCRYRCHLRNQRQGWLPWLECSPESADDFERSKDPQWEYEVQRLYTAAPAAPVAVPLTDAEIEAGRRHVFSTENPFCPCNSKTMRKAVWWAERTLAKRWGIKLEGGKA